MLKIKQNAYQIMYIIQMGDTNYYKIGITDNINRRLQQLQTGNPLHLEVVKMWEHTQRKVILKYERVLHRYFTQLGQRTETNKEWFMLTKDDLKMLTAPRGARQQNELIEKILKKF